MEIRDTKSTTVLSAGTLTGDTVRNSAGDDLGTLEEIVIDLDRGRVAYVVLASGGFLGLGGKFFALPWDIIKVDTDEKVVIVDVEEDVIKNAPGFDKDNWPDLADLTWVEDVYRYYGREPYWVTASGN